VTRGYTLLVLGKEGARVRELRVSRTALWAGAIAVLSGVAVVGLAGYALASWSQPRVRMVSTEGPMLRQGLAQHANLILARSLQSPEPPKGPCGANMILVEGNFCPAVFHRCQSHTDPEGSALHGQRCAEYKQPAVCLSPKRQRLRYCIDRDENVAKDETLPQSGQTLADARKACESAGKRLCSNVEWTFACEGELMNPYPYGFVRDSSACNADRDGLVTPEGELNDLRAVPGTFARCQSAFGVRDLTGNLEEYAIEASTGQPVRKGGYWQPGANHCRLAQPHSDPSYRSIEVGFRCCADAAP
jgi:formylglycine-generating enzyme